MMRRMIDLVIAGVGLSAGGDLYDKAKKALVDDDDESREPAEVVETPAQRKAREKAEAKALEAARVAREKAEREKAAAQAKTAREIESELAALKKKIATAAKNR